MTHVHLAFLFTEGFPNDKGRDLTDAAERLRSAAEGVFDSVWSFTPRGLLDRNEEWADQFQDYTLELEDLRATYPDVFLNEYWVKLGLLSWKPTFIAKALSNPQIMEGDILFYHDADVFRYPIYLDGMSNVPRWLGRKMKAVDVLAFDDNSVALSSDCRQSVIDSFRLPWVAAALPHLWGGAIALKKNSRSFQFLKAWEKACTKENLWPFNPQLDDKNKLRRHSVDQAVLGCVWHARGTIAKEVSRKLIFLGGQRRIPPKMMSRFLVGAVARRAIQYFIRLIPRG